MSHPHATRSGFASPPAGEPLVCPACGFDHVHPVRVEVISPGAEKGKVTVDNAGIRIDPNYPPVGRGVGITLDFVCEDGHRFTITYAFHKGQTLRRVIVSSSGPPNPRVRHASRTLGFTPAPDGETAPETIWRN